MWFSGLSLVCPLWCSLGVWLLLRVWINSALFVGLSLLGSWLPWCGLCTVLGVFCPVPRMWASCSVCFAQPGLWVFCLVGFYFSRMLGCLCWFARM